MKQAKMYRIEIFNQSGECVKERTFFDFQMISVMARQALDEGHSVVLNSVHEKQ